MNFINFRAENLIDISTGRQAVSIGMDSIMRLLVQKPSYVIVIGSLKEQTTSDWKL